MGHMQLQESVWARAKAQGFKQELYSLAKGALLAGLWGAIVLPVLLAILGVVYYLVVYLLLILPSGIEAPANEETPRNWVALLAFWAFLSGMCVIYSVFQYLLGRELNLYGERGLSIDKGREKRTYWSPEEIKSVEVTDGPKGRVILDIYFVDAEKYPPLHFITKCPVEKRDDLNCGLEALMATKRSDKDAEGNEQVGWHTEESDRAVIFMYWAMRITILVTALMCSLIMLLAGLLTIFTGERVFLVGVTLPAPWLLVIPFGRRYLKTRMRPRYEGVVERRRAIKDAASRPG